MFLLHVIRYLQMYTESTLGDMGGLYFKSGADESRGPTPLTMYQKRYLSLYPLK